jgi:hypothetical protein
MSSWFHIPLPTPVILNDSRSNLIRVFLLCETENGIIHNVHVYDGSYKVQEFNDVFLEGEHRIGLDGRNTFNLEQPHVVAFGIGISFFYAAAAALDGNVEPSRLIVGSAGGDYIT